MYHHAIITTINMDIGPKSKRAVILSQKVINQSFMPPPPPNPTPLPPTKKEEKIMKKIKK
jgi:hypothetical protein